MPKASIALQILPLYHDQETSMKAIERAIDQLRTVEQVTVSPFETVLEGDYHELMQLLSDVIENAGRDGENIFANVKIRYQKEGQMLTSEEKTAKYRT